jgi:hypothetical protein
VSFNVPWAIGCDVGVTGAFLALNIPLEELHIMDIPHYTERLKNPQGKRQFQSLYDENGILEMLRPFTYKAVLLKEVINAFSTDFAFATGSLCYGDGLITMACLACAIKLEKVAPTTWKAFMCADCGGRKATPRQIVERCRYLIPAMAPYLTNIAEHNHRACAGLILYYLLLGDRVHDKRLALQPLRCRVVMHGQSQLQLGV